MMKIILTKIIIKMMMIMTTILITMIMIIIATNILKASKNDILPDQSCWRATAGVCKRAPGSEGFCRTRFDWCTTQSKTNQSFNQPFNQSIIRSAIQSINHSISHSINQSFDQPFNRSIIRSIKYSISHSINQSFNQSIVRHRYPRSLQLTISSIPIKGNIIINFD